MRVLVTGASGMLGTALTKELSQFSEHTSGVSRSFNKFQDLRDKKWLNDYIRPWAAANNTYTCVYHLAAHVGGVKANARDVSDFYQNNIEINSNLLSVCEKHRVAKVVSVLSTCVYPDTPYVTLPLTEDQLHLGPPHPSNFGYAYAKRMLDVQTRAIRKQHGLPYITVIPNNLFGEGDNFHLEDGHVIPALIRRIHEAKMSDAPYVTVWGDGSPLREFTYAHDAARILRVVAEEYDDDLPVNIGCTEERSIRDVAETLREALGYKGDIVYDVTKPMGQYRKPSSNRRLIELTSWKESDYTPFETAIRNTCDWFLLKYPNIRGI